MDANQNSGSFMSPAGGGGVPLKASMDRRGMSGGVLNQNTQDPNAVPPSTMPAPTGGPNLPPQGGISAPPMPMSAGGMPPTGGNPEAQLILKAQDSYLKSLSKIAEANAGVQ